MIDVILVICGIILIPTLYYVGIIPLARLICSRTVDRQSQPISSKERIN